MSATLLFTWGVMALLVLGSWLATRRIRPTLRPGRWQNFLEALVEVIRNQIREVTHQDPTTGGHPVMMLACPGLRVALATTHRYRSLRQAKPGEGGSYVEGKTSLKPSERPDRCKSCPAKAGHQPEPSVAWSRSDPDCEAYTGGL
ncbi:hypothetical protein [Methylomarinovum caldicuralii]|uniref:hypothetical protein n=1 Tax=Methylomarinovum caldicuralii TaxID=438856 RepID=UPI002955A66C|nr:hypothetical protein [Methylomarinovum caldicuralii]